MSVSRLDIAKDQYMDHPLHNYQYVFNRLGGVRLKSKEEGDGYTFKNKSTMVQFYDKLKEYQWSHGFVQLPDNRLMRCEVRGLKKDSVNRLFQLRTLKDLEDCGLDYLDNQYKKALNRRIFKNSSLTELDKQMNNMATTYAIVNDNEDFQVFLRFLQLSLPDDFLPFRNEEEFKVMLRKAGITRYDIHIRGYRKYLELRNKYEDDQDNNESLLNELKSKFAA